jgi:hypothetical protein
MSPLDRSDQVLRDALDQLEESVPGVPHTPSRHVGDRGFRATETTITIVVAAVLAVVVGRGWFSEPVGQPTPPPTASSEPEASPSSPLPSDTPPTEPTLSWATESFPSEAITAAGAFGNTWIALGAGEAWLSTDGTAWQQGVVGSIDVPPPTDRELNWGVPQPVDIVRHGEDWYALGRWTSPTHAITPVVFTSKDGLIWTHMAPSEWWGYNGTALASNGSTLIVTNAEFGAGLGSVFVSDDGNKWTEHFAPGGPATMLDVYADSYLIVAVGYRYSDEMLEVPVAWISMDGSSWAEADPIPAARGTTPWAVGRNAAGSLVMLTTTTTFPEGCTDNTCLIHTLGAWSSADGQKWQETDFPAASAAFGAYTEIDVLPVAGGLLAVAATTSGSAAWLTADGVSWKSVDFAELASFSASAAASDGESVRLFGAGEVVSGKSP